MRVTTFQDGGKNEKIRDILLNAMVPLFRSGNKGVEDDNGCNF